MIQSLHSKILLSSVLIAFFTQNSIALTPVSPPSSSSAPAGGYFSRYFQNMTGNPCAIPGQAVVGFNSVAGNSYMTPNCSYLFWLFNGGGEIEYTGNTRIIGNLTVTGNIGAGGLTATNINTSSINSNPIGNYVSVPNLTNLSAGSIPKALSSMTPNVLGNSNIFENASGYIGIGTSNPLGGLHIRGGSATIYFQDPLRANDIWNIDHYSDNGRLAFMALDGAGVPQREVISYGLNGNIGIGTSNPGGPLEIKSSSDNALRLTQLDPADGWNYIELNSNGGGRRWWFGSDSSGNFHISRDGAGGTAVHISNANLEVSGTIKISGGTPGPGKVLTSVDANGNATWQNGAGSLGVSIITNGKSMSDGDYSYVNSSSTVLQVSVTGEGEFANFEIYVNGQLVADPNSDGDGSVSSTIFVPPGQSLRVVVHDPIRISILAFAGGLDCNSVGLYSLCAVGTWYTGAWSGWSSYSCPDSGGPIDYRDRTVECRDAGGNSLPDMNCSGAKPQSHEEVGPACFTGGA